jgi:hypothetical protein
MAETEGFAPATSPSGISKLVINITHLPPEAPQLPHLALEQPQWQPNQYRLSKAGIKARFTACMYSISASGRKLWLTEAVLLPLCDIIGRNSGGASGIYRGSAPR